MRILILNGHDKFGNGGVVSKIYGTEEQLTRDFSNYLKIGNKLGWCEYDTKVNYINDIYIKVPDLEDNLLGVYRILQEEFNVEDV